MGCGPILFVWMKGPIGCLPKFVMQKYGKVKKKLAFVWLQAKNSSPSKITNVLIKKIGMPIFWHAYILVANRAKPEAWFLLLHFIVSEIDWFGSKICLAKILATINSILALIWLELKNSPPCKVLAKISWQGWCACPISPNLSLTSSIYYVEGERSRSSGS
jgi:hypothetical protein